MSRWTLYLCLFIILALVGQARVIYMAFFVYTVLYFGGGHALGRVVNSLEIGRATRGAAIFPGEKLEIELTLRNPSLLPVPWLSGQDHLPLAFSPGSAGRWVVSLPPKSKTHISYNVTGRQRGVYQIGPLQVHAGDFLALHQRERTFDQFFPITVYPKVSPLGELGLPSRLPFGNSRDRRQVYADPSRLSGVRSYQSGDPLRSIHWKATAHKGSYQVKQFEFTVNIDTVVLLNMNEEDYSVHSFSVDSELAIETAASLSQYAVLNRQSVGLVTNGGIKPHPGDELRSQVPGDNLRIMARSGTEQLARILTALAALELKAGGSFPQLINDEAKNFPWGAVLMVVTPVDSKELIQTCLSLIRSGYQVLVFVTGKQVVHQQLLATHSQAPLQLYHVVRNPEIMLRKDA